MTELLCLIDFDVETCPAIVVLVEPLENGKYDLVLDKTCFYPRGGGQDWDTGTIRSATYNFIVEEVRLDEAGDVHHFGLFDIGLFKEGEQVNCKVNHERRTINTRLHSAAHVIDMAVDNLRLDWVPGKGQHYPDLSAIEYSGQWDPDKADDLRKAIEDRANEYIKAGSTNELLFMSVEQMHTVCRFVPTNIPKNKPGRVVMYGQKFGVPCGGTHVKDIKTIGKVGIPKLKNKKGVIRLSYTVEGIN
jgi:Ser-tRNA(Ala) deacylase AlaX